MIVGWLGLHQETIYSVLVGSAIGIAATWLFAYIYYRRAGEDLEREAQRLRQETVQVREEAVQGRAETAKVRHLVNALGHALENAHVIEATWNSDGDLDYLKLLVGVADGQGS